MGMRRRLHELVRHLVAEHASPPRLGLAVGLGLFIGTLPLYGFHLVLCLVVAWALGLNKVTTYLAANISNPLVAPVLVAAGIVIGEALRFGTLRPLDLGDAQSFIHGLALLSGQVPDLFLSCLLGDAVLGAALGLVGGATTFLVARRRAAQRSSMAGQVPEGDAGHAPRP